MMLQMCDIVLYPRSVDGNPRTRCLIAFLMIFVLICNFATAPAYNIDTNYPILYPNNATNWRDYATTKFARGYFGYSVLLHRDSQRNSTWLFVGTPRGNYTRILYRRNSGEGIIEPGVVYRCAIFGECLEIKPTIIEDESGPDPSTHVMKAHSWFGAAMSIERTSDFLTICAPRTVIKVTHFRYRWKIRHSLHGMCYNTLLLWQERVNMDKSYITSYNFQQRNWEDPMQGFSIAYASPKFQDRNTINYIVGAPNYNIIGVVTMVRLEKPTFQETYRRTTRATQWDLSSAFGYSTTAGYYFDVTQLFYASGDPTWNLLGQVVIIQPRENPMLVRILRGSDIGEYFGASLATGDLNQDGLDDLVVGAPHWKNDNGRVHIYLGTSERKFDTSVILKGTSENALFGYAVACGDLDGDGFSDIIVGAPWEESGAIYIYNGDANLRDKMKPIASQRITMQLPTYSLPTKPDIRTFGFSIAEPVDVDANGYADIAIGAYKSGHAVILRSRPVVSTSLTVVIVPNTLQRNVNDFLVQVCVKYRGYDLARTHAFNISLTIDEEYKRTKETLFNLSAMNALTNNCLYANITLLKNIQEFIEPIAIYARHEFAHKDSPACDFCKTCPVERKSDSSKGTQALLSFDIECGSDKVCNSNLSVVVEFLEVKNNLWVIGSNDITLKASLMNHAEPSYLTTIVFTLPLGIVLRSILPSCYEDIVEDNLMVTCNVGNPLGKDGLKIVKLDLDMRHFTDGSLHGRVLEFITEIQTRSVNRGMRVIKSLLTLQSEAFLSLNGKANERSYYLSGLDKEQLNVSFQHTYQILKSGATSIKEARLLVNVPTSVNGSSSLVFLHKPKIYIAGEYSDCLSHGIDVIDTQQNDLEDEITPVISNLDTPMFNTIPKNKSHELFQRDISSHTKLTTVTDQPQYITEIMSPENSTDNLTQQRIVYINCSSPRVNCSMVNCDLSALKTQQDIGKLAIRLIFNATKLKDAVEFSDETIVMFSTEARIEIIKPANRIASASDSRRSMNLTTQFHNTAKLQKLKLWIVLVSVLLGLLLLCIVIILLYMAGFFKRKMKQELAALKKNEMTEDVKKSEVADEVEINNTLYISNE